MMDGIVYIGRMRVIQRSYEKRFHGFTLEAEFPPFIDQTAGFDDTASGRKRQIVALPPKAPDRDHGFKLAFVPDPEGGTELGRTEKPFPPIGKHRQSLLSAG